MRVYYNFGNLRGSIRPISFEDSDPKEWSLVVYDIKTKKLHESKHKNVEKAVSASTKYGLVPNMWSDVCLI